MTLLAVFVLGCFCGPVAAAGLLLLFSLLADARAVRCEHFSWAPAPFRKAAANDNRERAAVPQAR